MSASVRSARKYRNRNASIRRWFLSIIGTTWSTDLSCMALLECGLMFVGQPYLLYLSNSPRSRMSEPPLDMDLTMLNAQRLERLSRAMRLSEVLEGWLLRAGGARILRRIGRPGPLSRRTE